MRRPPRPESWPRSAWMLCLVLAGCATPHLPQQPLSAEQQHKVLQDLDTFSFTGRAVVEGQNPIPALEWRQQHDVARVRLSGPIGIGSLQLEYRPGHLRLTTSRGEYLDGEAERELANAVGFVPPFEALRYWVLGVPAPGSPADQDSDGDGTVQKLLQQDWLISYQRRVAVNTAAGELHLPALLVATHDNLRLRLVIDRWRIH